MIRWPWTERSFYLSRVYLLYKEAILSLLFWNFLKNIKIIDLKKISA
jgi:hypothetical protein